MISSVKRTLLRRSGTLKMFFRLESNAPPPRCAPFPGSTKLPVGERVAPCGGAAVAEGHGQDFNAPTGGLDGGACRRGHGVDLDTHGAVQLPTSEDLDQGTLADAARGVERGRSGLVPGEGVERVEIHDGELHPERIVEALELRDPLGELQLATLEARGTTAA